MGEELAIWAEKNSGDFGIGTKNTLFNQKLLVLEDDEQFVSHARVNLRTRRSLEDDQ